jgi:hypothetical protein
LDINNSKITINKFQYGDLGRTIDGESEFKLTTKEGDRVGGTFLKLEGCICMDVQKFEGHSTRINLTHN